MRLIGMNMGRLGRLGAVSSAAYDWSASSLSLPTGFTFTRSGTRTYLNNSGVWASAATDVPRFDSQPGVVGALISGARTNKVTAAKSNPADTTNCTTSGDAGGALSVVDGTVALGSTFALFGSNVYKVDNSAGSTAFYVRFGGTTGGTSAHSLSCIAYGAGDFLLYDGTTETGAQALDGASFARLTKNNVTPANSSQQFAVKCAAGEIAYVVVPQLEQATFASSPIIGSTGAVTVNAEVPSRTVVVPTTGFTAVWDIITPPDSGVQVFGLFNEGLANDNNRIQLYTSGTDLVCTIAAGGVSVVAVVMKGSLSTSTRYKAAIRFKDDDFASSVNGAAVVTDTSCALPLSLMTKEWMGTFRTAGNEWHSHILGCNASPTVWRPPVSDAELQALSAI